MQGMSIVNVKRFSLPACAAIAVVLVSAPVAKGQSASVATTSVHDSTRPEVIPIVLHLQGLERQTMTLPSGLYVFSILNRSGLSGLEMVLEQMSGSSITGTVASQLFDAPVDLAAAHVLKNVQLTPGTYRLREIHMNHPLWVAAIQVH